MELRDAMHKVALEGPSYGRPRMTRELQQRGWEGGETRVRRLMREDNLLCVRKGKFVITTDSRHGRKIYPHLAHNMILTATDQLWVANITYIRLREEFAFLAVILDAYSRCVIGWALDRTLEDELTLAARRRALARRMVQPGLVHHSDRGSQCASGDYTDLLKQHGIAISMSHKGNPWDNAAGESFMKTLKSRKCTVTNTAIWPRPERPSASSWRRFTTTGQLRWRRAGSPPQPGGCGEAQAPPVHGRVQALDRVSSRGLPRRRLHRRCCAGRGCIRPISQPGDARRSKANSMPCPPRSAGANPQPTR